MNDPKFTYSRKGALAFCVLAVVLSLVLNTKGGYLDLFEFLRTINQILLPVVLFLAFTLRSINKE